MDMVNPVNPDIKVESPMLLFDNEIIKSEGNPIAQHDQIETDQKVIEKESIPGMPKNVEVKSEAKPILELFVEKEPKTEEQVDDFSTENSESYEDNKSPSHEQTRQDVKPITLFFVKQEEEVQSLVDIEADTVEGRRQTFCRETQLISISTNIRKGEKYLYEFSKLCIFFYFLFDKLHF